MRTLLFGLGGIGLLFGASACGDDFPEVVGGAGGAGGVTTHPDPDPLPPLSSDIELTTKVTLEPAHDVVGPDLNPSIVADLEQLLADGFGKVETAGAWKVEQRTLDGSAPPAPGPNPKQWVRFVHLADTQLADDESPARLAGLDPPGEVSSAFRPQESYQCRVLNAAVRTINKLHEAAPIDFVVLGGDNADAAQQNEVRWFTQILDGAPRVECDSGADDDPVSGPDNDPKDPFFAEGLDMPWRWVTGNHDVLAQGIFPVDEKEALAVGNFCLGGARDWREPGGPVRDGEWIADEDRHMLSRSELMEQVAAAGDGHGIDAGAKAMGKAYYTFDVEGTPLRFVVMDSAAETGGSRGVIHQADIDSFLKPALDDAASAGKLVILASHHASRRLTDGDNFGGTKQADAVLTAEFIDFVGAYDNVIMHLGGHTHEHYAEALTPTEGTPYWEVETAALADFPHQMRFIEIIDQDNGFISIRATAFDYSTEGDPVAADGRARGIVDFTSGYLLEGRGLLEDRNVELWIAKPAEG